MNQHVMRADEPGRRDPSGRPDFGLKLSDAQPLSGIPALWRLAALVATLGMGAIALVAGLYFGRSIILPVVAAVIVGITLGPGVKFGTRLGIPPAVSAVAMVMLLVTAFGAGLTFFAAPLTEWIARAPEIGMAVQEKLRVLDYPLSVFRDIKSAIMPAATSGPTVALESNPAEIVGQALILITPAVSQFVVFFGLLTFVLNYIPYIGPAIVALVLLCVGLVAMPSLAYAALAPALFIAIATIEGHFITPSLVGRKLTLSPFVVFLALAFWTWLWGPIGAFLAVPLVIVSFVVLGHLLPRDESSSIPD